MWKSRLINNAIALAAYAAVAVLWNYSYDALFRLIPKALDLGLLMTLFSVVILVACGFFLKPVKKRSFLSVISPLVASVLAFIIFIVLDADEMLGYFAFNPLAAFFYGTLFVLLSPAIPSLLLYAGVLLRKLKEKHKTGRILAIIISVAVLAACVVTLALNYNENSKRTKFMSETPNMWFVQRDPLEDFTTGELVLNGQPIELLVYSSRGSIRRQSHS